MAGSGISVTWNDRVLRESIRKIADRMGNVRPALEINGGTVLASIQRNFELGGRPDRWAPLSPVTLARRKGGKIVVVKGFAGGLLGSIHSEIGQNLVVVGTDKKYAAVHQFGASKGAFGRTRVGAPIPWGNIPARPFAAPRAGGVD